LLNQEDWDFLYKLYIDWVRNNITVCNGEYKRIDKIRDLGLIRKVKIKNSRKNKIQLTQEGLVFGIIVSRQKGDLKHNKTVINVDYW
jgi:hypothetical protein